MQGKFKVENGSLMLYPIGELEKFVRSIEVEPEYYPRSVDWPDFECSVNFIEGYIWGDTGFSHTNPLTYADLNVMETVLLSWFEEGKICKEEE